MPAPLGWAKVQPKHEDRAVEWHIGCTGRGTSWRMYARCRKFSGETVMATTVESETSLLSRANWDQRGLSTAKGMSGSPHVNVGTVERQVSLAAGIGATVLGISRRDVPGLLMAALGASLLYRGATGHCSVYGALGVDSRTEHDTSEQAQSIQVTSAFLIDKPVEELYAFWRNLENLPSIMSHLESVHV